VPKFKGYGYLYQLRQANHHQQLCEYIWSFDWLRSTDQACVKESQEHQAKIIVLFFTSLV
jgi:hypothetical protein